MRRIALLGTMLVLSACSGLDTFVGNTHWFGNPNQVQGNSENLRRVRGQTAPEPVLRPEPGDVWPGPVPPQPTLQQLMREENMDFGKPLPAAPTEIPQVPTLPGIEGQPPNGAVPPIPAVPGLPPLPNGAMPPSPAVPGLPPLPNAAPPAPPQRGGQRGSQRGHTYQTPEGQETGVAGPGGYETLVGPNGQPGGIVVPNGNGTSTIIMPDGKVVTVPTPK